MTGVQTCALPICFPVTIGGIDLYLEVINGALVIRYWGEEVKGELSNIPFDRSIANSDYDQLQHPGSAIGGVDITNDILVGVNSATTAQQSAFNGVCDVITTNYGAGSTMYQKSSFGHFAVLKNVNDANKTFGTTFYGFGLDSNNYRMNINCGAMWSALNRKGTNTTTYGAGAEYGYYGGG